MLRVDVPGDGGEVDRGLQSQGTSERLSAHRQLETLGPWVHPGTATRHPVSRVGHEGDPTTGAGVLS